MSAAKTIVRNAVFSYGRTLITAALTLFSSRWILADLGASDFGIYGLVGGLLAFISLIEGILNQGVSRYIAYSTGGDDPEEVKRWFNVAANIYFLLPLVLLPAGLLVGEVFVRFVLRLPPDRLVASLWVVRFSLLSICATMVAMPYQGLLNAKQHLHISASVMLCHSSGLFVIALVLPYFPGDHLIVYAALVAASMAMMQMVYVIVCRKVCVEAKVVRAYWWKWDRVRKLMSYSGWLAIGAIAELIKNQGVAIAVNWMKGTVANAGMSIGNQLACQTGTLYNAFAAALNPELAKREGAASHEQMLNLAKRATRIAAYVVLMVGLPLFLECEYVLKLWLKTPPPYAVFFTRIILVTAVLYKLRIGHMMAFQAMGKVKRPQILDASFYVGSLLVLGIAYLLSRSLEFSFNVYAALHFVYAVAYAYLGSKSYDWPIGGWLARVVTPALVCAGLGYGVFAWSGIRAVGQTFFSFAVVVVASCVYVTLFAVAFIFVKQDRELAHVLLKKIAGRFRR